MKKYELEHSLDRLLSYIVKVGPQRNIVISELYKSGFNPVLVELLVARGMVQYLRVSFDSGPVTFNSVVSLTPMGLWFHHSQGFVKEAVQKDKEQRRFNFEGWKLGWDSIGALLALIVSLISLYISATK